MTLTFNPGVNPSFPFAPRSAWPVDSHEFTKPYVQTIPRTVRPIRTVRPVWNGLTVDQRDYIESFFNEKGAASSFYWTLPDAVASPKHRGPDLAQVTVGGAPAGVRTYYVKYTWFSQATGQETRPSPVSTLTVQGGKVVTVTVPIFPAGVPSFRIYAGQTEGTEWAQAYSTVRTWQQPAAELLTLTSLAPATNTLKPAIKWRLVGVVEPVKDTANRYSVQLEFAELHA